VLEKLILDRIENDFCDSTINKYYQEYQAFHGPFNLESLLVRLVVHSFDKDYPRHQQIDITKLDESVFGAIAECVKEISEKDNGINVLQFFFRILSTISVSKGTFEKMTCKSVLPTFPLGSVDDDSCGILFLEHEQRLGLSDPPPTSSTTCLQWRVNRRLAMHFFNKPLGAGETSQGLTSIQHRFQALPKLVQLDIAVKKELLIQFRPEITDIVNRYHNQPEVYEEKMQQLARKINEYVKGSNKATA
jgi:hypothetical protein